jgi:2-octaprenyl-6-methoxyphenol hydroxylase
MTFTPTEPNSLTPKKSQTLDSSQLCPEKPCPEYDVIVVGGGIVGAVAACGLGQMGLKVAIVEAASRSVAVSRGQAYSINLLSAQVFDDLGLWQTIRPQVETYRSVQLSDGDYGTVVKFSPEDIGAETIGYVAEHRVLIDALQAELERLPTVDWICPARVVHTVRADAQTLVTIDRSGTIQQLKTALVVAADGHQSPLRTAANIKTIGWKYWQSCVVAFIQPEYPHDQIAYERFQPDGPFAILPLPNGLCRIVWTALNSDTDRILNLSPSDFMAELRDRYGDHMGQLTLVGEPSVFPVRLLHSMNYVQPGLALIGDAAHCCHPVGGQGINLGIRDAAALVNIMQKTIGTHANIGSLSVLKQYERWRMWENLLVLGLTDTLTRVFSNQILPIVVLRRISLWVLQHIAPIRSRVLRLMQGLTGRSPRIMRYSSAAIQEAKNDNTEIRRTMVRK